MVSRRSAILNLFETKAIDEKMSSYMDQNPPKQPAEMIIVKLGKAVIELPSTIGKGQLQTILKAVIEL